MRAKPVTVDEQLRLIMECRASGLTNYQWRLEHDIKPGTFYNWVKQFEKAVNYAQNHKELLMTYLEDGRCSLSNNLSENGIRPFTMGRKNWLFSNTPQGAQASAMVYTIVEMAKVHKQLNIYKYLNYLLENLPRTKLTDTELGKLCPLE